MTFPERTRSECAVLACCGVMVPETSLRLQVQINWWNPPLILLGQFFRWSVRSNLRAKPPRSEEHTSELQSLRHLVCRLLLEKKNWLFVLETSGRARAPKRTHGAAFSTRPRAAVTATPITTASDPWQNWMPGASGLSRHSPSA